MARNKKTIGEKLVGFVAILFILLAGIVVLGEALSNTNESSEIEMAETPISVEDVRPAGKLLLSSVYVDEMEFGEFKSGVTHLYKKYRCLQTLTQEVFFTMNLDDVKYELDSNCLYISLPEIVIEYLGQDSNHFSENEDVERDVKYDPNPLFEKVKQKIVERCETPENRVKAKEQAKVILHGIFSQFDKEVVFIESLPLSTE